MGLRMMGHCTICDVEDDVAYSGVADCGHRGCASLTIGVANHGTEDDDIVGDGLLDRQRDRTALKLSTLKATKD